MSKNMEAFNSILLNKDFNKIKEFIDKSLKKENQELALLNSVDQLNIDVAKYLIDLGVNVNVNKGYLLTWSIYNEQIDFFKYVLGKGFDINFYYTVGLFESIRNGKLEFVKYFNELGFDIHQKNNITLISAITNDNLEIVKYLVDNGADVFAQENKALINAVHDNSLEIVKYFIEEKGADVNLIFEYPIEIVTDDVLNWATEYRAKKLAEKLDYSLSNNNKENKKQKI